MSVSGTENPADDESRQEVAVEKETGGSYVVGRNKQYLTVTRSPLKNPKNILTKNISG